MEKRLYRSQSDRMIWGVCGGLAKYFDMDPVIIRIIFVLLVFANGLGIPIYIIMTIVVPLEGSKTTESKETIKENIEEIKKSARELGHEVSSTFAKEDKPEESGTKVKHRRTLIGIALIVIGILILMGSLNLFWWFRWFYLWPIILVTIGLIIIFSSRRKK